MGQTQWARVSRNTQHPHAIERVNISARHAMIKTVKLRVSLSVGPDASISGRVWNSICAACLGERFMADHCTIEYADCFPCGTNYGDIERSFNDLDWTLVDCGSTIHICRDKDKLYNLRPHVTNIRGIVGNATAVSDLVGDRDLVIRDSSGVFRKFVIKNVVYMPNATRDILGTPRLEKSGWWPDLRQRFLYNEHTPDIKFPFFRTKRGLTILPSVKSFSHSAGATPTIPADTVRMLDQLRHHEHFLPARVA